LQSYVDLPQAPFQCKNLVAGRFVAATGNELEIRSLYIGQLIGTVALSKFDDVDAVVRAVARA